MKKFLAPSFAALVLIGSVAWTTVSSGMAEEPAHLDSEVVAMGKAVYAAQCSACHGDDLEGQPDWKVRDADGYLPAPPHDQTGHTWHHPTAQLFEITKYGTEAVVGGGYRSNMAGYDGILSDDEILAVLAYIKSTWPRHIIEQHDEIDAAYEAAN